MSGPQNCFVCTTKFGLFKKQYNCASCNCSACKDCLSFQTPIPGKGATPQNVCRKCYSNLQSKQSGSGRVSPPANFKREMVKKQQQQKQHHQKQITPQDHEDPIDAEIQRRLQQLRQSHEARDVPMEELEERLRKLCESDPSITTEEIEYRLAKLKGSRPPAIRVHSIRRSRTVDEPGSSSRNEPESVQARKLIKQFTEEVAMETNHDPLIVTKDELADEDFHPDMVPKNTSADDLIELAKSEIKHEQDGMEADKMEDDALQARLSRLNDAPPIPLQVGEKTIDLSNPDMDEESAKLIRRLMEEDRLERDLEQHGIVVRHPQKQVTRQPTVEEQQEDEFPWCFMCNDDAVLRCLTCEGELFCRTCFRIVHQEPDMKGHKTAKFTSKQGQET